MSILARKMTRQAWSIVHRELATSARCLGIQNVVVVGGALMGSGIAQVCAMNNFNVTVADESDGQLQACLVNIGKSMKHISAERYPAEARSAKKFTDDTLGRIQTSQSVTSAVETADLVIEAITENLQLKQTLFKNLDEAAPEGAIFASNTSSLTITEIASLTSRKDRFGGFHLFTPVPLMELCEVIRTKETSEETFEALVQFAKDIGKTPIACEDTPGFVVNKLLMPNLMEAIRFYESGNSSVKDIDTAMKLGAGQKMGPFEQIDYIGLDTLKRVIDGWREQDPDNTMYKPSKLLDQMVEEKKYGRKHMLGFYKYMSW